MRKSTAKPMLIALVALIIVAGLFLWQGSRPDAASSGGQLSATTSAQIDGRYESLPEIGDMMGDFKVTSVSSTGVDDYEVRFSGETTVEGEYYELSYDGVRTGEVCFDVGEGDSRRIPRLTGDNRRTWFCFGNPDVARKELGISDTKVRGPATVIIADYVLRYSSKEVADNARLVSMKSLSH
jgi:hypothetical protein